MENTNEKLSLTEKWLLIKGDISGIQEFIFNVKSKGAARSLKGRSFFMKILTEISITAIFDVFNVNPLNRESCRISTSGGNFYLKVPDVENYNNVIDEIQLKLSKGLFYSGISVVIQAVKLDEKNYKECLEELNEKIRQRKQMIYPIENDADFNYFFQPGNKTSFQKTEEKQNGSSVWEPITLALRTKKYISIVKEETAQLTLTTNPNSLELIGYKCLFHDNVNDPAKILLSEYLESVFPLDNYNNQKEFEDLVRRERGNEKLGILKMDVDNLGATVENVKNLETHIEFDKKLREFFNKKLYQIIRDNFLNKIYTVTAGGDDSFFVGHWNAILKLADKISSEFQETPYFKEKKLSISAGFIIVGTKFPVIRFAQLTEEALHKAKYKYEKGNICLFDEVIAWNNLKEIMKFKNLIINSVESKSKGLLAKARQTAIKGIDEDVISLKENWEIAYYLRDIKEDSIVAMIRENNIKASNIKSASKTEQQNKRTLRLTLPIAARLAELEMR